MSADNGIYILETLGRHGGNYKEYRVRELQAVENVSWDNTISGYNFNPDVEIRNARDMWRNCKVTTSRETALRVASKMLANCDICEYGISFIRINRVF